VTPEVAVRMRGLFLAVAELAAVVTAGSFALWPRADRITRENCERIQSQSRNGGMTLAQAVAILGPPGDYRTGPTGFQGSQILEEADEHGCQEADWTWQADHGFLRVYPCRDDENRVAGAWFLTEEPIEQTPLENFRWRVKRVWRKWFPE
jgi:hypothetical protein